MANSLALVQKMIPELDKVFKYASKTSILDTPNGQIRKGTDASEVKVEVFDAGAW